MKNQRLVIILGGTAMVLIVPLIAMQFTDEVSWNLFDFLVASVLLVGAGVTSEVVARKIKSKEYRLVVLAAVAVSFLLLWAELAVGIFGSPLARS